MTEHQLAKRAAMLHTAREMIAEKGFDAITVRDLAVACRVSVPTLYNQFGGKDQMLAAAIEDHFRSRRREPTERRATGFPRFEQLLDDATTQLLIASEYQRRLLEAFASLESTTAVQQRIAQQFAAALAQQLEAMSFQKALVPWVNPVLLAAQVTTAFISTAVVWSSHAISNEELPVAMIYATRLILLGVSEGELRSSLERQLMSAQADLIANDKTILASTA